MNKRIILTICATVLVSFAAKAGDSTNVDQTSYWLFNPRPAKSMRPFVSDEVDKTTSPFTID